MQMTPLDIRRNEFTRSFRGYNREEVEGFLAMVADEVEGLVGEHRELTRRIAELEKEVGEFRQLERTLMESLVTAQRTSDEMRQASKREAEVIGRDAQIRGEQQVEKARIEAERMLAEARQKSHRMLEEARQDADQMLQNTRETAHQAIEASKRQAEETYHAARKEAEAIEQRVQSLVERKNAFVAGLRAFLGGQLDALAILSGEEPPKSAKLPEHKAPIITEEETEALAALDRELAEFAALTAPRRDAQAATKRETKPTATHVQEAIPDAAQKSVVPTNERTRDASGSSEDDDSEVLVNGKAKAV